MELNQCFARKIYAFSLALAGLLNLSIFDLAMAEGELKAKPFKLKAIKGVRDSGHGTLAPYSNASQNITSVQSAVRAPSYSSKPVSLFQSPTFAAPTRTLKANTQQVKLETGISVNVPKTPEDVTAYLLKMRIIIMSYDNVVAGTLMGSTGLKTDADSINTSKDRTQLLAAQINAIVPPAELKQEHMRLASTLLSVGNFLVSGADGSLASLISAPKIMSDVHTTMEGYHSGVKDVISAYGLNGQLDPFSGESPELKARFADSVDQFKTNKFNALEDQFAKNQQARNNNGGSSSLFGGSSSSSSSFFGSGSGLGSSGFSSGGLGLDKSSSSGDLTSVLNKLTGGNGSDMSQLGNILSPDKLKDLGKMMQELGHE